MGITRLLMSFRLAAPIGGAALLLFAGGCSSNSSSTTGPGNGVAADLVAIEGDGQEGVTGEALPTPLGVQLWDETGQPLSGVEVTWAIKTGGGAVSATTVTTNETGRAEVMWTLGREGDNEVTASVAGLPADTFTATADPPGS